ncbi:hypothetical protein BDZ97DRAFT_682889 [Flammula alnicola]|nr:hypothetical protein BDZ97DRAFT_682889 [Flammula alnicola]
MQCAWPQLTRLVFRGIGRPWPATHLAHRNIQSYLKVASAPWPTSLRPIHSNFPVSRRLYSVAQTTSSPPNLTTLPPPSYPNTQPEVSTEPPEDESQFQSLSFSHAEIGRVAAQAVRVSIRQGNLADAYLVVRSLHYARLSDRKAPLSVQRFLGEIKDSAIPFDSNISPRLPSHTLLHGLIRLGLFQEASKLAQNMMDQGIRVRCKSLETTMLGLLETSRSQPPGLFSPLISLKSIDVTNVKPLMSAGNENTQHALLLLQAARRSGQRSTHNMFKYLMTLCIINGEIILGSLLFGVLVRDWQAREMKKHLANTLSPSIVEAPRPILEDLKPICEFVNWNLKADRTDESSELVFSASLQALANLAYTLDKRQIPFNLESVITSLYNCPRTSEKVWIPGESDKDPPRLVDAYDYFHDVLDRLIHDLPSRGRESMPFTPSEPLNMVDPLNMWSYNALLHYSLRHRHSIERARMLLTHMKQHRYEPLDPNNTTTFNILDRARKDFPKGEIPILMAELGIEPPSSLPELAEAPAAELDPHALSTRITVLIRSGQPQAAVDATVSLLPGLFPPSHPPGTPRDVIETFDAKYREEHLDRAVLLGPVVFTSILNAFRKSGRTGLAERIFLYALEAENRSFQLRGEKDDVVKPWCLPVHAYTTMVQVYANERRKMHAKKNIAIGWGLTPDGRPLTGKEARVPRHKLARRMIVLMYRSMKAAPEAIHRRVAELRRRNCALHVTHRQLEPPMPDVWFFQALLDVFIRVPLDPIFPAIVKEMAAAGYEVPQGVEGLVYEHWGDEAAADILSSSESGMKRVERNWTPIGYPEDDLAPDAADMSLPVRGSKRWKTLPPRPKKVSFHAKEEEARKWDVILAFGEGHGV